MKIRMCALGCEQEGKFKLNNGKWYCNTDWKQCPKYKIQQSVRTTLKHKTKNIINYCNKNRVKLYPTDALKYGSTFSNGCIKKIILENGLRKYKCSICSISEWLNKKISLELDHIDGDNKNNNLENLRFLCPNCHSQTPTYGSKNKKEKINDIKLKGALEKEPNIRRALLSLGLMAKGSNYIRAKKLLYEIEKEKVQNKILKYTQINGVSPIEKEKIKRTRDEYNKIIKKKAYKFQQTRIHLIRSGVIDITKYGWVQKFSNLSGIKPQKVNGFMKKYCPDLLERAFKKKNNTCLCAGIGIQN